MKHLKQAWAITGEIVGILLITATAYLSLLGVLALAELFA